MAWRSARDGRAAWRRAGGSSGDRAGPWLACRAAASRSAGEPPPHSMPSAERRRRERHAGGAGAASSPGGAAAVCPREGRRRQHARARPSGGGARPRGEGALPAGEHAGGARGVGVQRGAAHGEEKVEGGRRLKEKLTCGPHTSVNVERNNRGILGHTKIRGSASGSKDIKDV